MTSLDIKNSVHYEGVIMCKQANVWSKVTSLYTFYGTQIKNYALKNRSLSGWPKPRWQD